MARRWKRTKRRDDEAYHERAADRVRDVGDMADPVADEDPDAVRTRLERMARGNPEHRDVRDPEDRDDA